MEQPTHCNEPITVVTDDRFKMPDTYTDPNIVGKEYLHKICIVGDIGTGKSALVKRLCRKEFSILYKNTIGVDFGLEVVKVDGDTFRMQYWDLAGQERLGNMTKVYYVEANGFFVMIDATRLSTMDGAIKWKKDIDTKFNLPEFTTPTNPIILLVNKMDLLNEEEKSQLKSKYDNFCTENRFHSWIPISVKDNIGTTLARDRMIAICKNIVSREPAEKEEISIPTPVRSIPKIVHRKLTDKMLVSEILLIIQNKFGKNNSEIISEIRFILCNLYYAPELEPVRIEITTNVDENLKKVISNIHEILIDEATTDLVKVTRISNFIMDYGFAKTYENL